MSVRGYFILGSKVQGSRTVDRRDNSKGSKSRTAGWGMGSRGDFVAGFLSSLRTIRYVADKWVMYTILVTFTR